MDQKNLSKSEKNRIYSARYLAKGDNLQRHRDRVRAYQKEQFELYPEKYEIHKKKMLQRYYDKKKSMQIIQAQNALEDIETSG